jgi:type I restriction enzyme R subunit
MDSNIFNENNSSKKPAIDLLVSMGYTYISPEETVKQRGGTYRVVLEDILRKQLDVINKYEYKGTWRPFSLKNIMQAVRAIDVPLTDGLLKTNEHIYELLTIGMSYEEELFDGIRRSFDLKYIDFKQPENNVFHVTEEFAVERSNGRVARPDIVLFINGIPFATIECKRSAKPIEEGISQTIRNQGKDYIPQLFKFVQIVMTINKNEAKYATCSTLSKFWSVWKEDNKQWLAQCGKKHIKDRSMTTQDVSILALFSLERVFDMIQYFTLFDNNIKKIARYQQYFAVCEIMNEIKQFTDAGKRKGGVIWHTQGSGKSLTMVMLAKRIMSDKDIQSPRVVIVTDRINLDKQIHQTFGHTKMKAVRAMTGNHLASMLRDENANMITTVINKFNTAINQKIELADKNIFVLVDESHRSQYKDMHNRMKEVFVNGCYIGFTGTPLMKKDRNTMGKFGRVIHKYTIKDGVTDGAIVSLLYEGKMVDQSVNKTAIDNRLEMITRSLNDKQKQSVMKKWSTFEKVASSLQRIELIAFDINEHFLHSLKGTPFNAMLACRRKRDAIAYQKSFEELGDIRTAVVISALDQREGYSEVDEEPNSEELLFWKKMLNEYGDAERYEESIKDKFINRDIDILIVVDKLLTGFDAPRAQVLYVDKPLKEHTLLQAIARVNRLYDGKDYGIIIDYMGLFSELDKAMAMYSDELMEDFNPEDLSNALVDVKSKLGELRGTYSQLIGMFLYIQNKDDSEEYEIWLGDEKLREKFYDILSAFGRLVDLAISSEVLYKTIPKEEMDKYKKTLRFYQELRRNIKIRYGDDIDHKEYEPKMQKLMNNYISAEQMIRITKPVDINDQEAFAEELERMNTPRAKAETISSSIAKKIQSKRLENPAYYKKFSERIEEIIAEYKKNRISDVEYFEHMQKIRTDFYGGDTGEVYPPMIERDDHAKAFYGVTKDIVRESEAEYRVNEMVDVIAELSIQIKEIIEKHIKVDWHNNEDVHRKMRIDIDDVVFDFKEKYNVEIDTDQIDKLCDNILTVSLRRYR